MPKKKKRPTLDFMLHLRINPKMLAKLSALAEQWRREQPGRRIGISTVARGILEDAHHLPRHPIR
jgi:hypothetical protein